MRYAYAEIIMSSINLTRTEVLTSEGLDPHEASNWLTIENKFCKRATCSHDMNEPRPNNNYSGVKVTIFYDNSEQ